VEGGEGVGEEMMWGGWGVGGKRENRGDCLCELADGVIG